MALLTQKIKAATLIEVMVATLIISLVFTLAAVLYQRVLVSGLNRAQVEIEMVVDQLFWQCQQEQAFVDHRYEYPQFTILKKVSNSNLHPGLVEVELEVQYHSGKQRSYRQLFYYSP